MCGICVMEYVGHNVCVEDVCGMWMWKMCVECVCNTCL